MQTQQETKRPLSMTDMLSVESIGTTIFLFVAACFCFLVVVTALSHLHAHATDDVFGPKNQSSEPRFQESVSEVCGAPIVTTPTE